MGQTSTSQITTKVRKNFLTYPYDYYCGAQARIFFGHIWVDDIVTLQYTLSQNKLPVYGYASQKFDAVARGQLIVNGNFTIAFKETGYLNLVHDQLKSIKVKSNVKNKEDILEYWLSKGKTIEQTLDELYMKDSGENPGSDFEDLTEALEDYLWDNFKETPTDRKITRPDEFDYTDKYGIDVEGFDIVMTFGDYTNDAEEHTVKVINDIHLIGESTVVTPDGAPIGINYNFIGRSIDEKISNVFNISAKKKETQPTGNDEIDSKLDAVYPIAFEVTIAEAYDDPDERINSIVGKDFYSWLGSNEMSYGDLSKMEDALKRTNMNDESSVKLFRSMLKENLLSILNVTDFNNTFNGGAYGINGYNIRIIRVLVKLSGEAKGFDNLPDGKVSDIESTSLIDRTLESIQFQLIGGKWIDFTGDDEYNMRSLGISDPDDLPKYHRTNPQGHVEELSKNEIDAEIKASANIDRLKMIYSDEFTSFSDEKDLSVLDDYEKQQKEDKRQRNLVENSYEDFNSEKELIDKYSSEVKYWQDRGNQSMANTYIAKLKDIGVDYYKMPKLNIK